jgi:fermentation-respiration switch protein FrsA (DUF1100 family)
VQFHSWLTYKFTELFTGDDPPAPMLDAIRANPTTRLLLVAAGDNDTEIAYNRMFADAAGDRAELWIVPGVEHTGGWDRYRDEYTQRVLDFLTRTMAAPAADPGV